MQTILLHKVVLQLKLNKKSRKYRTFITPLIILLFGTSSGPKIFKKYYTIYYNVSVHADDTVYTSFRKD